MILIYLITSPVNISWSGPNSSLLIVPGDFSGTHTQAAQVCFNNLTSGLLEIQATADLDLISSKLDAIPCFHGSLPVANTILCVLE